jgi:uncharacterized protein (TIGR00290 family)
MPDQDLVLYWSGGKDSAMALHDLRTEERYGRYRVASLLTTLTEGYDRISGHGVRESVLDRQVACLGIDVHKTFISRDSTMAQYESVIQMALLEQKSRGVRGAVTGDIFVEKRRMTKLKDLGMLSCCPLLRKDGVEHMRRIIDLGFKAYTVCVDPSALDQSFVGCPVDQEFLNRLPPGVHPCGENGEYHTFTYDGPGFSEPVRCHRGEVVFRGGFWFCDVLLDN